MKRKIEVDQVFKALRQLPPDIPFGRVAEWVNAHQSLPWRPTPRWRRWLSQWKNWN